MRVPIALDCDPGQDDAIAILVAARYAELVAITTVNGNVGLDLTTRNALVTTQIAGLDVPVHAGASRPLVAAPQHAEHIHGSSGLDGPWLPPVERSPAGHDAAGELIALSHRIDGLWVVATGPLTNVALAIHRDPGFVHRIAGLAVMGGGVGVGNVTAAAEFNAWADPEATAIVHASGVRPVMLGTEPDPPGLHGPDRDRCPARGGNRGPRASAPICSPTLHDPVRRRSGPRPVCGIGRHPPRAVRNGRRRSRSSWPGSRPGDDGGRRALVLRGGADTRVAYTIDVAAAKELILDAVIGT